MEEHGDEFAGCGGDLQGASIELDGVVVMDLASAAQREVEIKKRARGARAHSVVGVQKCLLEDLVGDQAGGGMACIVLAFDFHLEDFVGVGVRGNFGMGQKGDHAFLEGAKAAFDLAFGLRGRGDEMCDIETAQRTLELASGIAVVVGRAWAKEAPGIGVDGLRQAVGLKGATEVAEVFPCGIA